MRKLTYEEVEQARIEAIAARATDRNRASMGAIVAAVVVGGTGAGPVAAVAVASLAVISQIQFWRNTTQDRESIAAFAENPLTANLDKLQESAVIRVLRSQKESQAKEKTHDQPTPRPHSPHPRPNHSTSVPNAPQHSPVPAVVEDEGDPVVSGAPHRARDVGAVDLPTADPVETATAQGTAIVGRGFQFQPGVGFYADGLVVRSDEVVEEDEETELSWFDDLFAEPWHCFVYGSTGDGKSTLVCNILHRLTALMPDAEVNIIDPKYPYSEWGEFTVKYKGDKELAKGMAAMGAETEKRLQQAHALVERGEPAPNFPPIIYVLDEANTAFTDYKSEAGANIKRIVSRGRALNVWGVFIGTSCNVGDYGLAVPDVFNCHRLALRTLAPLAIAREESLSKEQRVKLTNELKRAKREHRYVALLQSGGEQSVVVLPPPHVPHAPTHAPTVADSPSPQHQPHGEGDRVPASVDIGAGGGDNPQSVPVGGGGGDRPPLIADISDEAIRAEFLKGKSYVEVLRGFGIPSGSTDAPRIHAVKCKLEQEIRDTAKTTGLNKTAEIFGVSKGSGAGYQFIRELWRRENPEPVAFSGLI